MKRIMYTILFSLFLFFLGANLLQAQAVESWDFESNTIGDEFDGIGWAPENIEAVVADDPVTTGNNVLEVTIGNYNAAPVLMFVLPEGSTLADYSSFTFKGYFSQGDVGYKDIVVEAYQTMPTGQFGNTASVEIGRWNRAQMGSTAWEDITVDITNTSTLSDTIYVAFGINAAGTGDVGGTGVATMWYADDVTLVSDGGGEVTDLVTQWGSLARHGWPLIPTTEDGSASMGGTGNAPSGNWATLVGGFDALTATETEALVATGKIEFVGGGPTSWSALRWGLFYFDTLGTLQYPGTDTARWSGNQDAWGYLLLPHSGSNDQVSWSIGGFGTQGAVDGRGWISSNGAGGALGVINQAPRNADMEAGVYNWAVSVHKLTDSTNELRYYLIKEDNSYWIGGSVVDTVAPTLMFNALAFGINNGNGIETTGLTRVNLSEVNVEIGDPIIVPEAPWEAYYIDLWGETVQGRYWEIQNDSSTLVGDGSIMGDAPINGAGQASIRGGFGQELPIKTDEAIIVSGELELVGTVGGEDSYNPLRFAISYNPDDTLMYALTDSAYWVRSPGWGYIFTPRTGVGAIANGAWGTGTVGVLNNGNWHSTNSNGGPALATILQAPRNSEMTPGTYDWAISVHQVNDTTNEIRWYLVKEDNSYWYGGIVTGPAVTDKLTGVSFNVNTGDWTELNVIAARVDYGNPIDIPDAPWEAYYIDQWGLSAEYNTLWPILNDSSTLVGDASMSGAVMSGWRALQGGFGQDLEISTEEALIVEGQIEFVGGAPAENAYTPIRYALTYQDSNSTLVNALTDSATWSHRGNHFGYGFHPRNGTGTMSNGNGGSGTVWTIVNGNWASTYSNNGGPIAAVNQAPRNAEMVEGVYDFAISVHSIDDTTNEIRWYMVEENNQYWFGGTVRGTATTKKFNSILLGVDQFEGTAFNVIAMQVDKGDPIDVPAPPFEAFYVDQWGFIGGRLGGWTLELGDFVGDLSISGSAPASDWSAVRGGFEAIELGNIPADTALVISGEIEFETGGFEQWSGLRFGVFYSDSAGTADSTANGYEWSGTENYHSGYLLIPHSGTNDVPTWSGTEGTVGTINNGTWLSTNVAGNSVLSEILQLPEGAVASAGTYEFAISIHQVNGSNEIRYYITKDDESYSFKGIVTDTGQVTTKFNSVAFAYAGSGTATAMNLIAIYVEYDVPLDPSLVPVENIDDNIPTVFALNQNYPNPFNPSTIIEFAIPQASEVSLIVYDVLGKEVAKLASGNFTAGNYKYNFNASNLSSGVYFYRLQAGDFVSVKKLMLLK